MNPGVEPRPAASLEGRVALVTGACTGLGRAIAEGLGRSGATVAVNHPHTPELADEVVGQLGRQGIEAGGFGADISRRTEYEAMVEQVIDRFGRWDILVGNAAVATTQPLVRFDEQTIDRIFAVNVKGVIWGMQLAEEQLSDGGRIINIGSSTTALLLPGYGVYDASKGAVEQLSRIGAHELGHRGITVNVVAPGATATESYAAGRGEQLVSKFADLSAFGRLGTPAEIADVVTFVASDAAGWITGQVLRVNGGTV